jgi:hypothetical protein
MSKIYRIPTTVAAPGQTVRARVRLAPPVFAATTQDCVIQNVGAYKNALLALGYEEENDFERSSQFMARCFKLLDDQAKAVRGSARVPIDIRLSGPARSIARPRY